MVWCRIDKWCFVLDHVGSLQTVNSSMFLSPLSASQAWLNEKFSPELLENKSEVVECVMEQLTHMVGAVCPCSVTGVHPHTMACISNGHHEANSHQYQQKSAVFSGHTVDAFYCGIFLQRPYHITEIYAMLCV